MCSKSCKSRIEASNEGSKVKVEYSKERRETVRVAEGAMNGRDEQSDMN